MLNDDTKKQFKIFLIYLIVFIITSAQLTSVSLIKILFLVFVTYVVDFVLSKAKFVGDMGAALINFIIVLFVLPFPASLVLGLLLAYTSMKPDIGIGVTLPIGQFILFTMWILAKTMF